MSNRWKFLIVGLGCMALVICGHLTGPLALVLVLVGVFCIIVTLYWSSTGEVIEKSNAQMSTINLMSYDEKTGTLTVSKRDVKIAKALKIIDAKNYTIKYEPEKLHIGAVTVGGVTTGGTYTTGGYNYIADSQKNGLCRLEYLEKVVNQIQLSDELYQQAQKSDIAPFLNSAKQIEVKKFVQMSEKELQSAINNMKTTGYAGNNFANKGLPTKEKCIMIMDWLTHPESSE